MRIGSAFFDVRLIDVVGPDRTEGRDVAGHASHEARHQCVQTKPQHAAREIFPQHQRHHHVVIELAGLVRQGEPARSAVHGGGDGDHAGQDHQEREQHLRHRGDERRAPRRIHRIRRERALHHRQVGASGAEGQHEPESHRHAEPPDAHRVLARAGHHAPCAEPGAGLELLLARHRVQTLDQAVPTLTPRYWAGSQAVSAASSVPVGGSPSARGRSNRVGVLMLQSFAVARTTPMGPAQLKPSSSDWQMGRVPGLAVPPWIACPSARPTLSACSAPAFQLIGFSMSGFSRKAASSVPRRMSRLSVFYPWEYPDGDFRFEDPKKYIERLFRKPG